MNPLGPLRIEEIRLPAGQEWQDAAGSWRFVRLHSGAAYWLGQPHPRCLVEGELLVLPPAALGTIRASLLNEVVLHGFSFAPDLFWGLLSFTERQSLDRAGGAPDQPRFLPSTHPAAQRFAALAAQRGRLGVLSLRAESLSIVAEALDQGRTPRRALASPGLSASRRFEQLVAQMPDREVIHYTTGELAGLCACSERHFNRLFREHFGASVRFRQAELRLLKARRLLAATTDRIADVALATGYRSLSLFNKLFKRRFGLTPSQWRRQAAAASGDNESQKADLP